MGRTGDGREWVRIESWTRGSFSVGKVLGGEGSPVEQGIIGGLKTRDKSVPGS